MTVVLQWRKPPELIESVSGASGTTLSPQSTIYRYEHIQASAAAEWIVNHNLGVQTVAVVVLSPGGVEVLAEVIHVSVNQLLIRFESPYAGKARVI